MEPGPAISVSGLSKTYRVARGADQATTAAEALLRRLRNPGGRLRFQEFRALEDVSFQVPWGEAVAKLHGKPLSFNNVLDLSSARGLLAELEGPGCVIVKHNNPCGVAEADQPVQHEAAPQEDGDGGHEHDDEDDRPNHERVSSGRPSLGSPSFVAHPTHW